jgi:hypothetical protein
MLDRVSLGKLVGSVINRERKDPAHEIYNGHVIQHEVLEYVPGTSLRIRLWAVDPEQVVRSGRYAMVAGWFSWLAMDMAACKYIGLGRDNCVTTSSHTSFTHMYRKPEVIAEVTPGSESMLVKLYAGSREVAYGHYFFKIYSGLGEDDDAKR